MYATHTVSLQISPNLGICRYVKECYLVATNGSQMVHTNSTLSSLRYSIPFPVRLDRLHLTDSTKILSNDDLNRVGNLD
jgi:hypothetical protein